MTGIPDPSAEEFARAVFAELAPEIARQTAERDAQFSATSAEISEAFTAVRAEVAALQQRVNRMDRLDRLDGPGGPTLERLDHWANRYVDAWVSMHSSGRAEPVNAGRVVQFAYSFALGMLAEREKAIATLAQGSPEPEVRP